MATVFYNSTHQSVGFGLDGSEPAGGHSQGHTSGDPIQNEESPDIETIDHAILTDIILHAMGKSQQMRSACSSSVD